MAILVCGGAGYIGSHAVHALVEKGEQVVIVDNLQTGHRGALNPAAKFYEGDIRDAAVLDKIFTENKIEAVIHFAANSLVGESMEKPLLYFNNNVYGMQVLLEGMVRHGVDKIVFSSTAATYGEPKRVPIHEDDETCPTNTYGETKLTMEKMMKWISRASGIRYVSLRYFNAAGALPNGVIGEDHATVTRSRRGTLGAEPVLSGLHGGHPSDVGGDVDRVPTRSARSGVGEGCRSDGEGARRASGGLD